MNWEQEWHGTCQNTYGEETKQLLYANRMGLEFFHNGKSPYNIDMKGTSVLDVGGGPVSLLLKCVNVSRARIIDPLELPEWVKGRYELAGILYDSIPAEMLCHHCYWEDIDEDIPYSDSDWCHYARFDEVWIYNVLQHVENAQKVIKNARKAGKLIRIFEWVDMRPTDTHPQLLTEEKLNEWLGGEGKVEQLNQSGCTGRAYYGIFPT